MSMKPNFVNSFDPYAARLEDSKRRRRCMLVAIVAVALLLVLVVGIAAGLSKSRAARKKQSASSGAGLGIQSLELACKQTAYPQSCISSLSADPAAHKTTPEQLVRISINAAMVQVNESRALVQNVTDLMNAGNSTSRSSLAIDALWDCSDNMFESMDHLSEALTEFNTLDYRSLRVFSLSDIHTWLSSGLTFYTTCFDGLDEVGGYPKLALQTKGKYTEEVLTNALSFFKEFTLVLKKAGVVAAAAAGADVAEPPTRRRLLSSVEDRGFPDWLSFEARRHLLQSGNSDVNAVVAKDGSGQFISIQEAVDTAPIKSKDLYVILVRQGTYEEQVVIPKGMTNLVLRGDGIDKTIIRGRRSVAAGFTTFASATFIVNGRGFIAQGLTIQNVAGPSGHQAVALRVSADQVAFHKCSIIGYQDTLYAHSNRQFYRECVISGTVDFIFGNAAAVFQRCDVIARLPDVNQRNMMTAQGRVTDLQNTGFSFQGCKLDGTNELKRRVMQVPTFLGRPWKDFSRTVIMQSQIGSIVNPAGWSDWDGAPSSRYRSLFYGEYMNVGQGSSLAMRVNWTTAMTESQAKDYTVGNMITGLEWLPGRPVSFSDGIMV